MSLPRLSITRRKALTALGALPLVALLGGLPFGCRNKNVASSSSSESTVSLFEDVTANSGIDFSYRNGEKEEGYPETYGILESLGGGVSLIDYDHSGKLSIFVTGGGYFGGDKKDQIKGYGCKLYKNLGDFKFKDVTADVGLDNIDFYTHGAAVGDYNNDGWPDLLVTGWGRVALFRNEDNGKGGRKFVEVTTEAKLDDKLWSTSACFMDLDGKGYPDVYIAHYVNWSLENNPHCQGYTPNIKRDVCPPKQFLPLPHSLYRNNCDGTFTDVSETCGLRRDGKTDEKGSVIKDKDGQAPRHGKGLAVIAVDANNDGKPEVFVANDTVDDFFYINTSTRGNLSLKEMAVALGVARDGHGNPTGSMGIGVADYDRSGSPSFYITTYEHEYPCLHHNRGPNKRGEPQFDFATETAGLLAVGRENVSWGTAFIDLENRGWEDIVVANGHVIRFPVNNSIPQLPVLLRNSGEKPFRFTPCTKDGGPYFQEKHCSRGLAYGDLDNDGRIDLVISNVNEPLSILRNVCDSGNHWVGIELKGAKDRDFIGTRVILESAGGKQTKFTHSGGSYASTSDPRLVFGLAKDEKIESLTIIWSHTGKEQKVKGLEIDHYWKITEGEEKPVRVK